MVFCLLVLLTGYFNTCAITSLDVLYYGRLNLIHTENRFIITLTEALMECRNFHLTVKSTINYEE